MSARRASTRRVLLGVLLVSLVLAGVVSRWADSAPDGLSRVAQDLGFEGAATPHVSDGSPFAGYAGPWAGVVGVLVVLAIAGGATWLLRRRGPAGDDHPRAD
ncbi:hypothetical protein K8Z61_00455 [Nocardioides sp. TRM66260-LWL]|uniref:PDGLE domain-containing protein n=1 Tax=Nocardioides sp. TRM66260-LWL TaxID=2874478 RepID=UPI001CC6427B|nr:PDGLE domain-containing protein [Nocardioides sp. TRM66260-LWL]MBZ5732957.1 hypothetical protein [Nocardioides sp. TRM66260-LWL]